ncbi:MAG TPA: GNAT family N-acetyltransferase [Nitrososphaerales archaeon]|nr:GNAT family N-acetyltransferase [Nitrososphaerales archaeon]HUK74413.1 GNAT family N-acetyltransferase [Nitrososphaerales archaeon]
MTAQGVSIVEVTKGERAKLLPILEDSFEGLYLWHARRTLQSIEVVRAARTEDGDDAGLAMLKMLDGEAGYVYYVAVPRKFRGMGVGGRLLDDALERFAAQGAGHVYASVEDDNEESKRLFGSRGFAEVKGSDMASRYGRIRSLLMYREMMVVPGEILLGRALSRPA